MTRLYLIVVSVPSNVTTPINGAHLQHLLQDRASAVAVVVAYTSNTQFNSDAMAGLW